MHCQDVLIAADFSYAMQDDSSEVVDYGQRAEEAHVHYQPIAQYSLPLVPPRRGNVANRSLQPGVGMVVPAAASAQISQEMLADNHPL